jgi:RNA polymerase sigma-70 factor, ECF subfamily
MLMRDALDVEAFAELFGRLRDPLFAYAVAVMLDRSAAEDVVQRTFELALVRRHRFEPERGSADGWLFGIARNVALDERRRLSRQAPVGAGAVAEDNGGPDLGLERADQQSVVFAALRALDRMDRELIALKFWVDLSHAEIGAVLGCSESNVGTRVHRAIGKLREICHDVA